MRVAPRSLAAVLALGGLEGEAKEAVAPLTDFLKPERPEFARAAVLALGLIGPESKTAVPQLQALAQTKDEEMRMGVLSTLADIGPGAVLGEIALLDSQPRSANAFCLTSVEVAYFDANALRSYLNSHRDLGFVVLINLARVICSRLLSSVISIRRGPGVSREAISSTGRAPSSSATIRAIPAASRDPISTCRKPPRLPHASARGGK